MGAITINGVEHKVAMVNGVPMIDGMTIDKYFDTLDADTVARYAEIGLRKLRGEIEPGAIQETLTELEFRDY
jgi:hypothetical protein